MTGLFACGCGNFRWFLLPDTHTMTPPSCHGFMKFQWKSRAQRRNQGGEIMDDFDWYATNKHAGNPAPFDSEKRDAHLRIAELLQAAIVFKNYADDRYNKDPRSCAIINTPIQQRLWLAIDAVREAK